jgi:hypothetical protein
MRRGAEPVRKIILAIMAATATILGLVNNAPAEAVNAAHQTSSTVNNRHSDTDPRVAVTTYVVPAGVATQLSVPNICTSAIPTATGLPYGVYEEQTTEGLLLVGDWHPGTFTVTLTCPGGSPSETIAVRAEPGPTPSDISGVGGGSSALDSLSGGYNQAVKHRLPNMYSFDPANPVTGATGDPITTKEGCPEIARPGGSSAGITALTENTRDPKDANAYCIDFASSLRGREPGDPPYGPGGVVFVTLANYAVSWATRDAASGGTNAPANLSTAQLRNIYLCKVTNWDEVGGKNAPIDAFLPQTSSETRSFFLTALGGGTPLTPGTCVSDEGNTLKENQGVSPVLDDPDAIVPFSASQYIAQAAHSAPCINSDCTPSTATGQVCAPSGKQNLFTCDETGVLKVNEINGTAPYLPLPWPCPSCRLPTLNPHFSSNFLGTLYYVVRYDPLTGDHIPPNVAGPITWMCTNPMPRTIFKDNGDLPSPRCQQGARPTGASR